MHASSTDDETYDAAVVVVAAGAWVEPLLGASTSRCRRLVVTQESAFSTSRRVDDAAVWPSFIHHDADRAIYGLETPGEGVKVAEHHTGPDDGPGHASASVDPERQRDGRRATSSEWFPGLDPTPSPR